MKNPVGCILGLTVVVLLMLAPSSPASAQVVVNNFLSPFTTIEVGPGYGYYRPYYHYSFTGYGSYDTVYGPRYHHHHHYYDRYGYYEHGPRYYERRDYPGDGY